MAPCVRRALAILHRPLPPDDVLLPLAASVDHVLAVDGGADEAFRRGLKPDAVIGDLDGISPEALARFSKSRVYEDTDPDTTDLDKAVRHLIRKRCPAATIVGSSSGRLDHTLGALAVLQKYHKRIRLELVDEHFTTRFVKRSAKFSAPLGTLVSLVSFDQAQGVTTTGLRWPLKDASLPFGTLGIHNEVVRNPASVRAKQGTLFLLLGHYVLRHD